jgi:hypothetical protein
LCASSFSSSSDECDGKAVAIGKTYARANMFLCQRDKSVSPLRETPVAAERILFLLPAIGFRNVTTNAAFLS